MKLKEGEVICPECEGVEFDDYRCPKCHGYGKLDWVEIIVGKRGWVIKPGVYVRDLDMKTLKPIGSMRKL